MLAIFGLMLGITMTLILGQTSYFNRDISAEESFLPKIDHDKIWKISGQEGLSDWSPREDMLAVSYGHKLVLLSANASEIKTLVNSSNLFIDAPRFSPDGNKIAYISRDASSRVPSSLNIINGNLLEEIVLGSNITGLFDWDTNSSIIYGERKHVKNDFSDGNYSSSSEEYQIMRYDLQTRSKSTVIDSIRYLDGFDVSPDGTKIVVAGSIERDQDCKRVYYNSCDSQLIVYNINDNKTDPTVITNSSSLKDYPRWSSDGSFITYNSDPLFCESIWVVTADGKKDEVLLTGSVEREGEKGCYENAALSKNNTMIAYSKNNGGNQIGSAFNPINSGMYFAHTDFCNGDTGSQCEKPEEFVPIITDRVKSGLVIPDLENKKSFFGYANTGYAEIDRVQLDQDAKRISILLEDPKFSRHIDLYIPSQALASDHVTINLNGTQFYPSAVGDCQSRWSKEYCQAITVSVSQIEGWSIVKISDNTTLQRSTIWVDMLG